MPKYLNQEEVTRYAILDAEIKKLEAEKKALREELIEGFKSGLLCPRRGPWILTFSSQERRQISWKDELLRLAKDTLGKGWKKYVTRIETEAPVVPTDMILPPKVNPDYEAEHMQKVAS